MQVSNWIVFGAAEVLGVLLLLCGFLLYYAHNLKNIAGGLREKLQLALRELKKSRKRCKDLEAQQPTTSSYPEHLEEQLSATKKHHLSLQPDQDIALDLGNKAPAPRQVASLRHAYLNSEKEACLGSEQTGEPNWGILQIKLQRLMDFYRAEAPAQEAVDGISEAELAELQQALANSQQRVANLEKFKTLFFELEDKWESVQQQAKAHQQELQGFEVEGIGKQEQFDQILQAYQNSYNDFGANLQNPEQPPVAAKPAEEPAPSPAAASADTASTSAAQGPHPSVEIQRLKAVAASQHQLITELQQRLARAYSNLEKDAVIKDLKGQLQDQLNYVDESRACIQNMELELKGANARLAQLQTRLDETELSNRESAQILSEAKALKAEHSKLSESVRRLQQENDHLLKQLQTLARSDKDSGANPANKQFEQLQQQYIDLENKYLALRMKSQ
ncbi:hypothetical protein G8764_03020 [Pseudomaricurvus alcaniphilus]|uniref:hypothetical protein n=1 Tax=Pseudomaricurvus alcaniphilus TaxID=1166482 RepID=UPI00140E86A7|nr:hypothetical protein [Pseudomaricurvus alcaniphilus]NHN36259.1 hypothetical protein [Pseudomaricurvus alcaniphilus]